ncbi:alkylhydroperoxidase [Aeromonas diversa CDC 2478-85]|uniref:Alkylhydroperoxidase n=1 Tax=Aeromonas diversa CDC 2478-85 TaxID=1268237 RepID=N9V9N5_9GAMM|nr:carboxymuconolactone decarboxylase family protein [Aeromonas diversa]ENY71992.1 alkylhydroperoxidase [Aeromonas diversa CDC 2478-85]
MSARIDYPLFNDLLPGVQEALVAAGAALKQAGLDPALGELVKLRASQLNGCSFCLQYHLNLARRVGVSQAKLDLLAAWHDATCFSDAERAALAWAEWLTRLPQPAQPDEVYRALARHFDASAIAALSVAIATINAWNRLGVGLGFVPPAPQ